MKITNLTRAKQLSDDLYRIENAITAAEKMVNRYTKDVDGRQAPSNNGLYQLHIGEYRDGSGDNHLDLSGCMVGVDILKFTLEKLKKQRKKIIDEIETL
jgi:hypothetical protein